MAIYNKAGEGVINQLSIDTMDVLIDPYTQNPIYQFAYKYLLNQDLSKISTGVSVATNAGTNFEFDIVNRLNVPILDGNINDDYFFKGAKVHILNKNAQVVSSDFATGLINSCEFTEDDNFDKFGSLQKDFGIRVNIDDFTNVADHVSEFYVYKNPLYINKVTVTDKNKTYLNPKPIGYQVYSTIVESGSSLTPTSIGDNFYYIPEYKLSVNNKNIIFDLKIVFAKQTQESIKITWGDNTENIAFVYNGGVFNGNGVTTMTNTSAEDLRFLENNITEINGKTYSFKLTHDYISNEPTNYTLSLKYDDNSTSQYEELNSYESFLPSSYTPEGNGIISSSKDAIGTVNFKVNFLNSPGFTSFQKVSIYGKQSSDVSIDPIYFIKDAALFSPDTNDNYSFELKSPDIEINKDYWFYLVPYSEVGTGFAWKVGPYQMDEALPETRPDLLGKTLAAEGLIYTAISEIKEGKLIGFNEVVLDDIEIGADVLCCEYFASVVGTNKDVCSSKIIVTNNFENSDPAKKQYYITEYAISDNSFMDYSLQDGVQDGGAALLLKGKINQSIGNPNPSADYVLYKTCLRKISPE